MDISHFEWREEYSVKVKLFDEQHQKLIEIIDDMYQAILEDKGKEVLNKVFMDLNEYANKHFAAEEKCFQEFNYPEASEHIVMHEKFRRDLLDMEAKAVNDDSPFEMLLFLENWWINHIMDVDKKYSKFFNEHNLY